MPAQRILILDDEPNIGSSLRLILEREGYAVTIARTIADARRSAGGRQRPAARCPPTGRQRDRFPARIARARRRRSGHHDLRPRHHRRGGRSHARRRIRFSREAARPRQGTAVAQERARAGHAAPRKRAAPRAGRQRHEDDRVESGLPARGRAGQHGGALGCPHPDQRRVRHRQGTAGRAHPSRKPVRLRTVRQR